MSQLAVAERIAVPYDVEDLRIALGDSALPSVQVYIDKKNRVEIEATLALDKKKSRRALALAMQGLYNNDLYGREKISGKASHITAIKHKGKLNDRIYCQEIFHGSKKIILITPYRKKVTKAKDTRTAAVIEAAAKHIFKFQEE